MWNSKPVNKSQRHCNILQIDLHLISQKHCGIGHCSCHHSPFQHLVLKRWDIPGRQLCREVWEGLERIELSQLGPGLEWFSASFCTFLYCGTKPQTHSSPTLSVLQFHELAVWVAWDPGKMQLLSFRCFFLRKAHQELGGLKGQVLLGKEVQQESRDGNQVAKEGRNKDTMHLTERRCETGSTPSTNPNVVLCLLDGSFDDLQTRSKLYDVPWAMLCHYSTWWCCWQRIEKRPQGFYWTGSPVWCPLDPFHVPSLGQTLWALQTRHQFLKGKVAQVSSTCRLEWEVFCMHHL